MKGDAGENIVEDGVRNPVRETHPPGAAESDGLESLSTIINSFSVSSFLWGRFDKSRMYCQAKLGIYRLLSVF
jgi:hypothetical protein